MCIWEALSGLTHLRGSSFTNCRQFRRTNQRIRGKCRKQPWCLLAELAKEAWPAFHTAIPIAQIGAFDVDQRSDSDLLINYMAMAKAKAIINHCPSWKPPPSMTFSIWPCSWLIQRRVFKVWNDHSRGIVWPRRPIQFTPCILWLNKSKRRLHRGLAIPIAVNLRPQFIEWRTNVRGVTPGPAPLIQSSIAHSPPPAHTSYTTSTQ